MRTMLFLVAASVAAAEVMVAEVIAKLKEVGLAVGAQKTHWTSHPKMIDRSIVVDGLAVLWEVVEFVGSKVCLGGNARHAIAHRSAQANKCLAKWRPVLSSSWLPRMLRLNIVKNYNVAGLSLEFECLDDGKGECEDGGERHRREEAAMDGNGPVVEILAQNWPPMDRQGQYERVDCHQRTCTQLGRSYGQIGPQRNLCEGLEVPRSSMVEMETASLERSRERQWSDPHPQRFKIYRWEGVWTSTLLLEWNSRGRMVLRMVLWENGVKVLGWNVAGDVFLSQTSMLKTVCVETGNDRLFPCGRVDPNTKND